MRSSRLPLVLSVAVAGLLVVSSAGAARRTLAPPPPEPTYDKSREIAVSGVVDEVRELSLRSSRTASEQVVVATENGPVLVHLGPSTYLKSQDFTCTRGDRLSLVGAQAEVADQSLVLAREVTKGERTVALRDAEGRPLWLRLLRFVRGLAPGSSN